MSNTPLYKNPGLPVEERVADLMSRMTLEEKLAQVMAVWDKKSEFMSKDGKFIRDKADELLKDGFGHICRPTENREEGAVNLGARLNAEFTNDLQKYAIEETRLGIPFIFHEEALHGQQAPDATNFPQAIALAGTWDPELVKEIFTVIAKEVRVRGGHHVLTPVLDVARDPRWGRIEETYGEDPYLIEKIGLACIDGFQGGTKWIDKDHVAATIKHFAAHGQPENGTNCGPAFFSEDYMREVMLRPFEAAIKKTDVWGVMPSYNEIAGVPSHANKKLLQNILREEWGFDGVVVSDYFAVTQLEELHHVAHDKKEAAKLALEAGVDIELPDLDCYPYLLDMFKNGEMDEAILDKSVKRMLTMKFALGLFEEPYTNPDEAEAFVRCEANQKLAYKAGTKAITLLKNENNMLPLQADKIKTLGVIGPNAKGIHLGGYTDEPRIGTDVLTGITAKVGDKINIKYAQGTELVKGYASWFENEVFPADPENNMKLIAEAVEVAKECDLVVLCVGGNEQTSREAWAVTHLGDRADLDMVGQQNELVQAVVETGVPVVVLMIHGKPLAINYIVDNVPAILDAWYLGEQTGQVVADTLFGDVNPGGKLPVTYPRSAGHIPSYYSCKPSARRGLLFGDTSPLFPFGHGLSYTTFEYSNLSVSPETNGLYGKATVKVDVKNTGDVTGDEIVQMYVRDKVASVTRPVKELKGFERITLNPGESKTVEFVLTSEELKFWGQNNDWVVEPGEFDIMVGTSSEKYDTVTYTLKEV